MPIFTHYAIGWRALPEYFYRRGLSVEKMQHLGEEWGEIVVDDV